MADFLIMAGVALFVASPVLWEISRYLRGHYDDDEEIRLHPYTTRKLAERQYRFFDDGGWTPDNRR